MPKVKLEVVDPIKGLIKAPDFCPYFKTMAREYVGKSTTLEPSLTANMHEPVNIVHASICALCQVCTFVPDLAADAVEIPETDVEKVRKAIMAYQPLIESLMKQSHYLQRNDRIPMAAFLSFATLQEIVYPLFSEHHIAKVLSYLTSLESPICIIAGMPLYFNRKLTKSAVQVVGEVEWQ